MRATVTFIQSLLHQSPEIALFLALAGGYWIGKLQFGNLERIAAAHGACGGRPGRDAGKLTRTKGSLALIDVAFTCTRRAPKPNCSNA
jgi:hypothetical protein